jgi:hypothetical protein
MNPVFFFGLGVLLGVLILVVGKEGMIGERIFQNRRLSRKKVCQHHCARIKGDADKVTKGCLKTLL